jgi:hypothetical protein
MKYKEYKKLNYAEVGTSILSYWKENNIFQKSVDSREGNPTFTFYEGPPSANGTPGIHHVMGRAVKDIFCRYKTLKGFQVKRKGGWDTHGLPVELQVEKEFALKPSTALIFSIAFGISVDDSIHFLAKYRQELFANKCFVPLAVSKSLRETGPSMIYTSIVLFAGFVIFAGSEFGGTIALGVLTSATLIFAMLTNLIVLPSLLLAFDDGKRNKIDRPDIEHFYDFYLEDEDEEIDLDLVQLEDQGVVEKNHFKRKA